MTTNTDIEVWAKIPGYLPTYEASSHGRIRSLNRDSKTGLPYRILAMTPADTGYLTVRAIGADGSYKTCHVHKLVASAFHGEKPAGAICLHYDDQRLNNRAENLRWGTYKDNYADSVRNGRRRGKAAVTQIQTEDLALAA